MKSVKLHIKQRNTLTVVFLAITFSSCDYIYSLFPIYTRDTLIEIPDLEGKWRAKEGSDYIVFQKKELFDNKNKLKRYKKETYVDSIKTELFSVFFRSEIRLKIGNEILKDKAVIQQRMDQLLQKAFENPFAEDDESEMELDGDIRVFEKGTYKMKTHISGKNEFYEVHFSKIKGTTFMNVAPIVGTGTRAYSGNYFSDNFFPVHTFFKVEFDHQQFDLFKFDMKKLSDLFEGNRIRLRHEKVRDKIVLTAKPKEIQEFYAQYSLDQEAFYKPKRYTKSDTK